MLRTCYIVTELEIKHPRVFEEMRKSQYTRLETIVLHQSEEQMGNKKYVKK